MRIIAGQAKGRRLFTPGGGRQQRAPLIRPTSDRARESLFSILGFDRLQGSLVLDLFAGTGALGIEALSRGAAAADFVDQSQAAVELIKKNISLCGFTAQAHVFKRDLRKGLAFLKEATLASGQEEVREGAAYNLVFLDPPYRRQLSVNLVAELVDRGLLRQNCMVVCEDSSSELLPAELCGLALCDQRHYGETGFWFYQW